jgi:hypothetical protein
VVHDALAELRQESALARYAGVRERARGFSVGQECGDRGVNVTPLPLVVEKLEEQIETSWFEHPPHELHEPVGAVSLSRGRRERIDAVAKSLLIAGYGPEALMGRGWQGVQKECRGACTANARAGGVKFRLFSFLSPANGSDLRSISGMSEDGTPSISWTGSDDERAN